jgi:hypothetical protein
MANLTRFHPEKCGQLVRPCVTAQREGIDPGFDLLKPVEKMARQAARKEKALPTRRPAWEACACASLAG